jgi:hypothetical protein
MTAAIDMQLFWKAGSEGTGRRTTGEMARAMEINVKECTHSWWKIFLPIGVPRALASAHIHSLSDLCTEVVVTTTVIFPLG